LIPDLDGHVSVMLAVFNEDVEFPLDHIKPIALKLRDKVMVLRGEDKGRTGNLMNLQAGRGLVQLSGSKEIKCYDQTWLASIRNNPSEGFCSEREYSILSVIARNSESLLKV
jgi:hypothetical protein